MTRPRCDAEIGKVGHWRGCKRPAVVTVTTWSGTVLCYCSAHRKRAVDAGPGPGSVK